MLAFHVPVGESFKRWCVFGKTILFPSDLPGMCMKHLHPWCGVVWCGGVLFSSLDEVNAVEHSLPAF